jgi:alkanesulfonate monooxygenase SsuD/methylene tetrahydromethanopterin reductase-like flavin-dependent oxidoreductase (luciferase family)
MADRRRYIVQFGIFDHIDDNGEPHGKQLADRLDLIVLIERLGFYAYHLAEHHGTPLSRVGATGAFLGAISQRTTTLRFGPLVYLLPLHHPLHLIEEIGLLDQLSGGRFQLGIGRGGAPIEHALFGVGPDDLVEQFNEIRDILLIGLRPETTTLSYSGKFYTLDNVPIVNKPVQTPHPSIWYGTATADSAAWTARSDVNVLSLGPTSRAKAIGERYREEWARLGKSPDALPMLGLSRRVVVADTDEEALRIARPAYREAHAALEWLWKRQGKDLHLNAVMGTEHDDAQKLGTAFAGSPASVRQWIEAQQAESGVNYLALHMAYGHMKRSDAERSLELFAREVMPAFTGTPAALAR